jgi:hypothetical protein
LKLATGNMWDVFESADLFAVTTCNSHYRDGRLIMGAGIAKQARDRVYGLDKEFGRMAKRVRYGLLVSENWPRQKVAAFQTKIDWREPSKLDVIELSTRMLIDWCAAHPTAWVHLNFPGIGRGGLRREDVLPVIAALPDTVAVWELG